MFNAAELFPEQQESEEKSKSGEKKSPKASPRGSPKSSAEKSPKIKKKLAQAVSKPTEQELVDECLERCKKKCLRGEKFKTIQKQVENIVNPSFDPNEPSVEQVIENVVESVTVENWMGVFKKLVDQAKAIFGASKNNSTKLMDEVGKYQSKLAKNQRAFMRIYSELDPSKNSDWTNDLQGQKIVQSFIAQKKEQDKDYAFAWKDFLDYIVEDITRELEVPEVVKPVRPQTPPPSPGSPRQATELEFVIPQERAKYTLVKQQNNFGAGTSLYEFGLSLTISYDAMVQLQEMIANSAENEKKAKEIVVDTLAQSSQKFINGFWDSLWLEPNQITMGEQFIPNQKLDQSRLMTTDTFTNMMENGFLPNPFIPYKGILSSTFLYMDRNQLHFYFWPDRLANSYDSQGNTLSKDIQNPIWLTDEFNDYPALQSNWQLDSSKSFDVFRAQVHDAQTYQQYRYDEKDMDQSIPIPEATSFLNNLIISRLRYAGFGGNAQNNDLWQVFNISWSTSRTIPEYVSPSWDTDRNLSYESQAVARGQVSGENINKRFCVWANLNTPQDSFVEFQVSSPQNDQLDGESTSYIRLEIEQRIGSDGNAINANFWNKSLKFISKKTSNKAWKKVASKDNLIWDSYVDHILDISSIIMTAGRERFQHLPLWMIMIFKGLLGFTLKNPANGSETDRLDRYLIMLDLSLVRIEGVPDNEVIHYLTKYLDFGFAAPMLNTQDGEIGVYPRQNFALRSYARYIKSTTQNVTTVKSFTFQNQDNALVSAILFRPFPTKKELFKLFRYFINDVLGNFGTRTYNITNLFDYLLKDTSIKTSVLDSVRSSKPKTGLIEETFDWFKAEIFDTLKTQEEQTEFTKKYPLYSPRGQQVVQVPVPLIPKQKPARIKNIIQSGISFLAWKSLFRSATAREEYLDNHKRDQFKGNYYGFSFGTKLHLVNTLLPWIESRVTLQQDQYAIINNDLLEIAFKNEIQNQLAIVDFDPEVNDTGSQISIFLLANNAALRVTNQIANIPPATRTELQQVDKGIVTVEGVIYHVVHPLHAVWYYRLQPRKRANEIQIPGNKNEIELFKQNQFLRNRILTLYDDYLTLVNANRIENELYVVNQTRWIFQPTPLPNQKTGLQIIFPDAFPKADRSIKRIWEEIEVEITNLIVTAYKGKDFWDPNQPLTPILAPNDNQYKDPFRGLFVEPPSRKE